MTGRDPLVLELEAELGAHAGLVRARPGLRPALVQDRYEVRSIIGSGAFGTVVRAWDPQLAREVAIKCVPTPDPARSFATLATEARALASINAAEVVPVFDCAATYVSLPRVRLPCVAIVMQYVPGSNLRRWIRDRHARESMLEVLISAARGLEAAHAVGLIHRDFKPENVLVTDNNQARIVDFGLAYRLRETARSNQLVARGSFGLGTPEYMAPETQMGTVAPASDQFSFGITAWELLTGSRPFHADTRTWAGRNPGEYVGADQLGNQLLGILGRALRFKLRDRFESVGQLRSALEQGEGGGGHLPAIFAGAAVFAAAVTTSFFAGKRAHERNKKS